MSEEIKRESLLDGATDPNKGGDDNKASEDAKAAADKAAADAKAAEDGKSEEEKAADAKAAEEAAAKAKSEGDDAEKPDWLTEDKFWDKDKGELNAELLFKNYKDNRDKIARGDQKPPEKAEDYKVDITPDDMTAIGMGKPSEDPLLKWFMSAAHDAGLGQDSFNTMVAGYVDMAKGLIPDYDPAAEVKSLGKDGQAIIDELALWGKGLHEKGILSDDDKGELWALAGTAAGVRLVQTLRKHFGEEIVPPNPNAAASGLPSKAELSAQQNDPKYSSDAAFRAKVDADYEKVYGSEPAGTSVVNET